MIVMASKTNNKKRESNVILFPKRFSKGREQITERGEVPLAVRLLNKGVQAEKIEELTTDFRRIRNTVPVMMQMGNNILRITDLKGFSDNKKAMKMGYAVLYLAKTLEKLRKKIEEKNNDKDMREFADYLKTAAFGDFLGLAWKQCEAGKDDEFAERYGLLRNALEEIAGRYEIRMLPYTKITKNSAAVGNIKKLEADVRVMPKYISKKEAGDLLARYAGAELDEELEKLLKMPEELLMDDSQTMLSDKEDFGPVDALQAIFSGMAAGKITRDTGYGIMLEETGSQGYVSFIDTKRGVAVKARVYAMHGEEKKGWDEFRAVLKNALAAAGKSGKNEIAVFEHTLLRIYDMSKGRFLG